MRYLCVCVLLSTGIFFKRGDQRSLAHEPRAHACRSDFCYNNSTKWIFLRGGQSAASLLALPRYRIKGVKVRDTTRARAANTRTAERSTSRSTVDLLHSTIVTRSEEHWKQANGGRTEQRKSGIVHRPLEMRILVEERPVPDRLARREKRLSILDTKGKQLAYTGAPTADRERAPFKFSNCLTARTHSWTFRSIVFRRGTGVPERRAHSPNLIAFAQQTHTRKTRAATPTRRAIYRLQIETLCSVRVCDDKAGGNNDRCS